MTDTLHRPDLVASRHRNVSEFLAGRGLHPDALGGFMRDRVGPGLLLLTSSPVHGLANPSSDLDFIRIQRQPIDGPRISTKIFDHGHHLEVVSFSEAELARNLEVLDGLAARPPAEVVAGLRGWDKRYEPRRKQTERIVNGITLDGAMPYLEHLPALGTVWAWAAVQAAVEQAVHTCLAEAAGELRGRVGYALNTLLHLMDAVLSRHGDVYTTRKWCLLRWTRFVRAGRCDARFAEVAAAIEELRREVAGALTAGPAVRLGPAYPRLVAQATAELGAGRLTVRPELTGGAHHVPLLPGSSVLVGERTSVVLGAAPVPTEALPLERFAELDAGPATALLRALRAGLARLVVDYDSEEVS